MFSGRRYDWASEPLYKCYYELLGPSRHLSVLFCTFVYMQVFNMLNSRKIHGEFNIFSGVQNNMLFIGIWFVITGIQCMIIFVAGKVFEVSPDSISGVQWGISLGFSVGMLFVAAFLKIVPDSFCPELGKK